VIELTGGGLSPKGLDRMRAVMAGAVERGDVPGLVALVLGATAYTDPAEDLIGVPLTQRAMSSPQPPRVFQDFWTTAYAAIDD
jgi:hypothetical protein